jgi:hypothetical protein
MNFKLPSLLPNILSNRVADRRPSLHCKQINRYPICNNIDFANSPAYLQLFINECSGCRSPPIYVPYRKGRKNFRLITYKQFSLNYCKQTSFVKVEKWILCGLILVSSWQEKGVRIWRHGHLLYIIYIHLLLYIIRRHLFSLTVLIYKTEVRKYGVYLVCLFVCLLLHTHVAFSRSCQCADLDGIVYVFRSGFGHGIRLLKAIITYHSL